MPHILVRFMAIEEEKKLKLSRRVASSWVVISMGVAITIGLVGNAMTSAGALEQLADSETIIVRIVSLISQFGVLPALLAGVILAGILAATMSTADSQLLAASSSISQDLGNDFLRCDFSGKRGMLVARTVMLGISLIAAFLARDPDSSVFRVVSFAWAGFGAAFGPVMLMALFWKRSNKWGALAGMLTRHHGLCLEVPHRAAGRRVGHLRAAARFPLRLGGHRGGFAAHPAPGPVHSGYL